MLVFFFSSIPLSKQCSDYFANINKQAMLMFSAFFKQGSSGGEYSTGIFLYMLTVSQQCAHTAVCLHYIDMWVC